ncbi:hypothetical protein SCOR_04725 [Sulfidibacter corallicola]|uniref:Tetratricopeptide repeat protein n=1 Tax=Sulfidibacter corallicola TaxID=2818388 RepID=A0A8A4TS85_SULCO|nr:hypothetical protein [Sulfidibacter corallicola]QTD51922.1 hypothetical protein J3U87_05570 [Sulfidibacter corallicola]
MFQLIDSIRQRCDDFIDYADGSLLLLQSNALEAGAALRVLSDRDRVDDYNLYWLVGEDFTGVDALADHIEDRLGRDYQCYLMDLKMKSFGAGQGDGEDAIPDPFDGMDLSSSQDSEDHPELADDPLADDPHTMFLDLGLAHTAVTPTPSNLAGGAHVAALDPSPEMPEPVEDLFGDLDLDEGGSDSGEDATQELMALLEGGLELPPGRAEAIQEHMSQFERELSPAEIAVMTAELDPPQPPPPKTVPEEELTPEARVMRCVRYLLGFLPRGSSNRLVLGLLPGEIEDRERLLGLLEYILAQPEAGQDSQLCMIARDQPGSVECAPELLERPDVAAFESVFDEAGADAEIAARLEDPEIPMEERIGLLYMGATRDAQAARRNPAEAKFEDMLVLLAERPQSTMETLAHMGLGDLCMRHNEWPEALACYEKAARAVVVEERSMLHLEVSRKLGEAYFYLQRYDEAEWAYGAVVNLASEAEKPDLMLEAVERIGVCRAKQDDWRNAAETWQVGVDLARDHRQPDAERTLLKHLKKAWSLLNCKTEKMRVAQALKQVGAAT